MSKKLLVLILALFMISGLHSKVKADTPSSQATSEITLHVENKGSPLSSSKPSNNESHENKKDSSFSKASNSEAQKNKKTPKGKLPLTNAQKETGLLVGELLLLLGLTCMVVKRKRGAEHE